jgi:hypothetical protein
LLQNSFLKFCKVGDKRWLYVIRGDTLLHLCTCWLLGLYIFFGNYLRL